ncbi:MAG: hypothetical protein QXP96_01700, partial [Thermoproteota archaeon]
MALVLSIILGIVIVSLIASSTLRGLENSRLSEAYTAPGEAGESTSPTIIYIPALDDLEIRNPEIAR